MSQDMIPEPWGAQDRFQTHFIVKTDNKTKGDYLLARTKLNTRGHFATKKVVDVQWIGGEIAVLLNSDADLKKMILGLNYDDASIWIEPTTGGVRIHGKWKSSNKLGVSKETFDVYDRIASNVKRYLGSPPVQG